MGVRKLRQPSGGILKILSTTDMYEVIKQWPIHERVGVSEKVNEWLSRGDVACVYRNEDLAHRDLGTFMVMSYGSPAAQIEATIPGEVNPPTRMPDFGDQIGWRYVLFGVYRGQPL